jgi:hypothetical protein
MRIKIKEKEKWKILEKLLLKRVKYIQTGQNIVAKRCVLINFDIGGISFSGGRKIWFIDRYTYRHVCTVDMIKIIRIFYFMINLISDWMLQKASLFSTLLTYSRAIWRYKQHSKFGLKYVKYRYPIYIQYIFICRRVVRFIVGALCSECKGVGGSHSVIF